MAELILFGGEKGGCGKSMVCKAAIQYHVDKKLDFACFDTDRSNPDIYRIYGKVLDCKLGIFSEGERYEDTRKNILASAHLHGQSPKISPPSQIREIPDTSDSLLSCVFSCTKK